MNKFLVGRNADGEWVNINNKCKKCGNPMPLPEKNKTYCPKCGTLCHVPSQREALEAEERVKKKCPRLDCGYKNSSDANYCIKCGTQLEQRNAIWKE